MMMEVIPKLPPIKTGINFLASSHFNIGKEPQWLKNSLYESSAMKDYPQVSAERVGLADLPPPAKIFSQSSTHDNSSVTRSEFVEKPYCRTGYKDASYAKTSTNFKSDRDLRIDSFKTTHTDYYKPLAHSDRNSGDFKRNAFEFKTSHIPQGDKEKVKLPKSEFKGMFNEHKVSMPRPISNPTFYSSNAKTAGDLRAHEGGQFSTTSGLTYSQADQKPEKVFEIAYHTKFPQVNIPDGDREKNKEMLTTMQCSFSPRGSQSARETSTSFKTFDRTEALKKIQRTTFRDGDLRLNCFRSTVDDTYIKHTGGMEPSAGKLTRSNASYVPEGDLNPIRCSDRISMTSNRMDFNKHRPEDYHNVIVDGSHIRTRSNVTFGKDNQSCGGYSTTTHASFPHRIGEGAVKHQAQTSTSSIPLDYHTDLMPHSSYKSDYESTLRAELMRPNPIAVDELKKSHIHEPMANFHSFDTTHQRTFVPQPDCRLKNIDTGRLQRSNVPLGTMK